MTDAFRPRHQPARRIYDAFQDEARDRAEGWEEREILRVWSEARNYSQEKGLPVLSLDSVRRAERQARGLADYGASWAYGVARRIREQRK